MQKIPLRILVLTVLFVFAVESRRTVQGIVLSAVELATINTPDPPATKADEKQDGKGNGVLTALGSPFKAIGRLFGHGKKDNNKLQRISEKDIKKFEKQATKAPAATQVESALQATANVNTSAQEHLEKGRGLLNSGNLNGAIAELSTAVSLDPKLSEAHTLLGIAYDRKGLEDLARQSFETATHAPNDEAMHLNNIGYVQYKNGEYQDAIKYLKRAVKLSPNNPRIWNNLGLVQAELDKYDDAYKSFARAMGEFDGRLNIAARLENHGCLKEAIKHLEQARALQPNSATVLARLVTLYERTDRPERAEAARNSLAAATQANAGRE